MKKLVLMLFLTITLVLCNVSYAQTSGRTVNTKTKCYSYPALFFVLQKKNYVKSMTAHYDSIKEDDFVIIEIWLTSNHPRHDLDHYPDFLRRDMYIVLKSVKNKQLIGCILAQGYDLKLNDLKNLFGKDKKI